MRIYKLKLDVNNYKTCFIEETKIQKADFKGINHGKRLNFKNDSMSFKYANDKNSELGDVFRCWDFRGLLVNNKFSEVLSSNNKFDIEFIKLQENFILLNNLKILDCLDNEKTKYEYFEKDIIGVEKYSFKQLDYPPLFQITLPNGYVELFYFVTDEFIKIINDNNIKGFLFEEVWDSEKD